MRISNCIVDIYIKNGKGAFLPKRDKLEGGGDLPQLRTVMFFRRTISRHFAEATRIDGREELVSF